MNLSLVNQLLNIAFRLFRVSSVEDLIKRALRMVFWVLLLVPLVLLPFYFLFFSMLGLH